jgi:hypothetical protein
VWCCGSNGALRRTLVLENLPRMFALSFDRAGSFFIADNARRCYAFRPIDPAVSDRFLRLRDQGFLPCDCASTSTGILRGS